MFDRDNWPQPSLSEVRRRARILVIDDLDFPYKSLFERDGYLIEKWDDIDTLTSLEQGQFDLILLDLKGIGQSESAEQGLGVLKHIRQSRPAQIVIAYSQEDWPLESQPFFHMADATLPKSADYTEFKREVDKLLGLRFSKGFYVNRALDELGGYTSKAPKAARHIQRALSTGRTDRLTSYLRKHIDDANAIDRALLVVQVGLQAASLWTS